MASLSSKPASPLSLVLSSIKALGDTRRNNVGRRQSGERTWTITNKRTSPNSEELNGLIYVKGCLTAGHQKDFDHAVSTCSEIP